MPKMRRQTLQREFENLLTGHSGVVFKVAAIYTRRHADREDLAQEICTQAWRSFGRFDADKGKFSTWLYRVALNVGISWARKHPWALEDRHEPIDDQHLQHIGGGSSIDDPDGRIAALYEHIGSLDPLNRALMMLVLDERSHAEMADILGISTSNVATKINRIKQKLRVQMTAAQPIGA